MRRLVLLVLAMASAAWAQPEPASGVGHLPYAQADVAELASAPRGFAYGQPCFVQRAVLVDLAHMLADQAAAMSDRLRGLSCFRTTTRQQRVFCKGRRDCGDALARSRSVAPAGYSEHGTGYAIDFIARPARGCVDANACFAGTAAGQWLLANGPRYGFELSFPPGNRQGIAWEPWHWRWVGIDPAQFDTMVAHSVFGAARARYPAFPGVENAPLPSRLRISGETAPGSFRSLRGSDRPETGLGEGR